MHVVIFEIVWLPRKESGGAVTQKEAGADRMGPLLCLFTFHHQVVHTGREEVGGEPRMTTGEGLAMAGLRRHMMPTGT